MRSIPAFLPTLALALFAPIPGPAGAGVIHVPGDTPRVTTAVNTASPGDTILVGPGTYSTATTNENFPLLLDTEGIQLLGSGADACTLDAAAAARVFHVTGVTGARVSGFTITGGAAGDGGGGYLAGGAAEIDHNVFLHNGARTQGSAIYANGGAPWIHHNVVWDSYDTDLVDPGDPHGLQVIDAAGTIEHNLIGRGDSNGLFISGGEPLVRNNIFLENGTPGVRGRGICAFGGPGTVIAHNLFHGNALAALLINVGAGNQNLTAAEANDGAPDDGVYGNLDGDPLLVDADAHDWALTIMSPAIDAGHPASPLDPDGTPADLGPFYFDQLLTGADPVPLPIPLLAAPNPFTSATTLRFELAKPAPVRIEVFDARGREVARVTDAVFPAGTHRVAWDGRAASGQRAAAGVYLVRLATGGNQTSARVVLTP